MRVPKMIEKKILPEYYHAVRIREKTFELRKDDSDYQLGDMLILREWDGEQYTGKTIHREITYILRDVPQYGLMEGYCILGLQPVGWRCQHYLPSDQTVIQNGEKNTHMINTGTVPINL